ncbi:polysaccharide pyruvyl transferase family protein, partial [Pluralibacter gergoviae]
SLINKIRWKLLKFSYRFYKLPVFDKKQNVAYVLNVSNHPNAGDQEITLAQQKFINRYLPDHVYVEIEKEKTQYIIDGLLKKLKKDDFVFIQGGGTVSDLYPEHEYPRRLLLNKLSNTPCKIIQFPISTHFLDNEEFKETVRVFNNNKNLVVFARESKTYNLLHNSLSIPCYHIPDIVISQDTSKHMSRGNDIIIMFRSDKECLLPQNIAKGVVEHYSNNGDLVLTDNYVENYIPTTLKNREGLLDKKFNEFRAAKLVITDRLHGMIFAYITKTPAVVFDNSYGKVSNSYKDWLSECPYIKYLDATNISMNDIIKAADEAMHANKNFSLDVDEAFKPLVEILAK